MAKARVLLVEDDPIQAGATKEILEKAGYDVVCAADGISAIKEVKTNKPDIILLDVILPSLDGYEVCRWLKLEEPTKGIPVIMLTVKTELSDKISGLHIGADDYLPKPYNELELNARIYASLRTKALQDELKSKNRQLEEVLAKVEYMAITDVLTGLYNRRRLHLSLTKEFERSKRYATPFSLILMDLDHFKNINDTCGHLAGDMVLQEVAKIIQKNIRDVDTAARYGGEEFIILLPNTKKEDAVHSAERMRLSIENHKFPDTQNVVITVSIGIAGVPDEDLTTEDKMIQCADIALYKAKHNGRNRTMVADGKSLVEI
ncbi:MAG: diguanylate cyclase [Nitrospirota bacterium]|nr:diguanylate cyclase [Nitrospirota bacterium]